MQVTSSKSKSQIYFVMTALIGKLASRPRITTLHWPPRSRVTSLLFSNVCFVFSDRLIVVKEGRILRKNRNLQDYLQVSIKPDLNIFLTLAFLKSNFDKQVSNFI